MDSARAVKDVPKEAERSKGSTARDKVMPPVEGPEPPALMKLFCFNIPVCPLVQGCIKDLSANVFQFVAEK